MSIASINEYIYICVRCGEVDGWFGHVERKEDSDWMKACRHLYIYIYETFIGYEI